MEEVLIIVPEDVTVDRIGEVLERHWTLEQGYASPHVELSLTERAYVVELADPTEEDLDDLFFEHADIRDTLAERFGRYRILALRYRSPALARAMAREIASSELAERPMLLNADGRYLGPGEFVRRLDAEPPWDWFATASRRSGSAALVTGTVVENTVGAEYEGVVYDRWLTIRLADGRRIDVFDPGPPIGEPLTPETPADLALVAAVPTRVRVDGARESDRVWQGAVVDTAWRAAPDTLEVLRPDLTEHPWVVIETPIGGLLLSPTDLPEAVREGASVSWDGRRLDLFGFTRTAP